jgi:hypothetical protein
VNFAWSAIGFFLGGYRAAVKDASQPEPPERLLKARQRLLASPPSKI